MIFGIFLCKGERYRQRLQMILKVLRERIYELKRTLLYYLPLWSSGCLLFFMNSFSFILIKYFLLFMVYLNSVLHCQLYTDFTPCVHGLHHLLQLFCIIVTYGHKFKVFTSFVDWLLCTTPFMPYYLIRTDYNKQNISLGQFEQHKLLIKTKIKKQKTKTKNQHYQLNVNSHLSEEFRPILFVLLSIKIGVNQEEKKLNFQNPRLRLQFLNYFFISELTKRDFAYYCQQFIQQPNTTNK